MIRKLAEVVTDPEKEIATVIVKATPEEFHDQSVVKVATAFSKNNPELNDVGKAMYFSRACIPTGNTNIWHHIGIYAWQRNVLERFINLKPSPLEIVESCDSNRICDNGGGMYIAPIKYYPSFSVDIKADLKRVNKEIKKDILFKKY